MTLFKVVGNYYTDMLDYLSVQYRKFGGNFDRYFQELSNDGKKELLDKVAILLQRVDMLKVAEQKVWETRKRSNLIFMIVMCCIMFALLAILSALCIFSLKMGEIVRLIDKLQTILIYFISYLIVFSILLLITLNMNENRKKAGRMMVETVEDIDNLKKIFALDNKVRMVLLFVAYKNAEKKAVYTQMLRTHGDFLKRFTVDLTQASDAKDAEPSSNKKLVTSFDLNYPVIFQEYRVPLLDAIKAFYADGKGYTLLRKELVASSNILILTEMRSIMQYYYRLVERKSNAQELAGGETGVATPTEEVLDRYVLPELMTLPQAILPPNPVAYIDPEEATGEVLPEELVERNESSPTFMMQFQKLVLTFFYMTTYLYQVYLKKRADEPGFDPSIRAYLPSEINLSTVDMVDFYGFVKRSFEEHSRTKLATVLQEAQGTANVPSYLSSTTMTFKDLFDNMYTNCIMFVEGDYLFPFNPQYMEGKIRKALEPVGMKTAYVDVMMDVYVNTIIPRCYETYQMRNNVQEKKAALVARMATNVMAYDVVLMNHSKYIMERVLYRLRLEEQTQGEYLAVLRQVDALVKAKKESEAVREAGPKMETSKFLELPEFTQRLDEIPYEDLRDGLKVGFFRDILDKFYFSVSNAIYTRSKTSKDIYFQDEKKFQLAKVALVMAIIIMFFGLVYNTLSVADDMSLLGVAMMMNSRLRNTDPRKRKEAYTEYGQEYSNVYIKLILPWLAVAFFVSLLFSFYRKGLAKYRFNKDTIDSNTAALRSALQSLHVQMEEMDKAVGQHQRDKKIKDLPVWNADEKSRLYKSLTTVVDKVEKCNYILSTQKMEIPFPYTEAIVDMFMIAVILLCMAYMFGKINPMERFREIRYLNKMKERGQYDDSDPVYADEVVSKAKCHDTDMDNIVFTVKLLFFLFIIMFLVFYATKVITSTSEFEMGLYTSKYYEEARCYE